jgi:hypothetical protein
MIASFVSRRAGAEEIMSLFTLLTSYLRFTASDKPSIMM